MSKEEHLNLAIKGTKLPKHAQKQLEKFREELDPNEEASLRLSHTDKVYDNGFQAIFGTSISVKQGEFLSLLGPSGCGKSTTLRMIAGLEKTTQGQILINGVDVTSAEPAARDLTMVFQNYALFPHLTVKKNIEFGLRANKKKLGEGGKFFKEMHFVKSENTSLKNRVLSINSIEKFEEKVEKFQLKIQDTIEKSNTKIETLKAKITAENEGKINTKISDLEKATKKKLIMMEHFKEAQIKKVDNIKADTPNLPHYEKTIEENNLKIADLEEKRKEAVKNDDYKTLIQEKVDYASSVLGLEYYLGRKPSALSGGQRQRVALGRSIVANPTLFLMDEPLSNLDAKLRATMRTQIRALHDKIDATTIYVTHDQIEAMTMSDKICVMSDGFVQQIGAPKEIYTNPANLFVAGFVGLPSMNLIEGTYQKGAFVSDNGTKIVLGKEKTIHIEEGQKIVLGVRPTDFSTDKTLSSEFNPKLKVKIVERELLGNEIQYKGVVEGSKDEFTFITNSYDDVPNGSTLDIIPLGNRFHIFDKETTISLSSKFNYETLNSLDNWVKSGDKIDIRREIMEAEKRKAQKKGLIGTAIEKISEKLKERKEEKAKAEKVQ